MIRNLSNNQMLVLRELAKYDDRATSVQIGTGASHHLSKGMRPITIGKVLSNLQKLGLVKGTKEPKEHSYRWQITESGRALLNGEMLQASPITTQVSTGPKISALEPAPPPPTTPDHFVFVVSEQKLADMLTTRLGSNTEDIALFKSRVRTLEMTITEIKRQMDLLRRERDTALEMAGYMEKRIASINEALRGTL